ncbi:MAG: hypothetical protein HY042_12815 [Spirochaetia bacterium]|nr:hypothetical protein [Spirochaetia bacterium]
MNAGFNGATSYGTCGFTGPCANGRVNYSGGQTSFHNPAGVIVYDRGVGLGGFFGLKQDTAINATNALTGKTFFGFKNNAGALPNASGDNFVTAKLVCNSNNCTATNVDPRTLASSGVASVITIGGAVNGKMTASVTTGGDVFGLNDNLVLAAATINGKVIITFTECSTGGCTTTSQHAYGFFAQQ